MRVRVRVRENTILNGTELCPLTRLVVQYCVCASAGEVNYHDPSAEGNALMPAGEHLCSHHFPTYYLAICKEKHWTSACCQRHNGVNRPKYSAMI